MYSLEVYCTQARTNGISNVLEPSNRVSQYMNMLSWGPGGALICFGWAPRHFHWIRIRCVRMCPNDATGYGHRLTSQECMGPNRTAYATHVLGNYKFGLLFNDSLNGRLLIFFVSETGWN